MDIRRFVRAVVCLSLSFSLTISNAPLVASGLPSADFNATAKPENPLTIAFTDQSTGDIAKWNWDFGDGSLPFIVSYEQRPEGTLVDTSVPIWSSFPTVSGNIIVCRSNEISLGQDFNQNKLIDYILLYYDITSKTLVNPYTSTDNINDTTAIALNAAPTISGDKIAFTTDEYGAQKDLDGDGKISGNIVMYYDVGKNKTVSTGANSPPSFINPSISGNIIAFATFESPGNDLDGNGSIGGMVVQYFDITVGKVFNTMGRFDIKTQGSVLAFDNIIAFPAYEWDISEDQNNDGDKGDRVLRYYDVDKRKLFNTGAEIYGSEFSIFENKIAFITYEGLVGAAGMDLNGDGDKNDFIVRYFDVSLGNVTNTGAEVKVGSRLSMSQYIIAFVTSEESIGRDLNGDGDTNDDVLRYYDFSTGKVVNTGAEIFTSPSVDGKRIAFDTDEKSIGRSGADLNGDGDTGGHLPDVIIRYFDTSTGKLYNTGAEGANVYISGNIIAFQTNESTIGPNGRDLNGNGILGEVMLRYFLVGGQTFNGSTSHIYKEPGTYAVSLTVTDSNGLSNRITKNIEVKEVVPSPLASFTATPVSGNAPLSVNFTDTSTNNPESWSWDFGDGGTSNQQNPAHLYSSAGTYSVSLTVSNEAGSNTKTIPNFITVRAPDTTVPTVSITQPLDREVVKDTITIQANASDDRGVNLVEFFVDNDGLLCADNTPAYECVWDTKTAFDGNHLIKAQAYDEAGKSAEDNITVNVQNAPPPINRPPVFNPIGNKTINEGQLLTFTVSAADPDGDIILSYSADNLPLGSSFEPSTRVFSWTPDNSQSGTYPDVHFEVSDGKLTDFEDITITVKDVVIPVNHPPVAEAGPDQVTESGKIVQLDGSLSFDPDGDILSYQWTQVSGIAVSLQNVNQAIASFSAPEVTNQQTLEFQLTVTDPGNLSSSDTTTVIVKPKPEVKPTIQITNPQNNSLLDPRSQITITANVQDSGNLVKKVSFLVNNKIYRAGKNRQGAYSYDWTVPYGYSKTYSIKVQAQDKQKNIVANDSIIVFSSSAPTISLTNPQNNQTVLPRTSIPITANLSPNNIGITKVEFYINNQKKHTDRNFPYIYNWRVPKETNQTYNIRAIAFTRDEDSNRDVVVGESGVTARVE